MTKTVGGQFCCNAVYGSDVLLELFYYEMRIATFEVEE